ncbi:hypothetical protein CDAR_88921 [Caerostris darwini]|uniref:Uncharacterized protein n=1 Tax=Caerostris darwini TaxID=1538125 RepID=A0AAV4V0I1_9ARAC|nr:hypothetical protein CDAR_88921 [Caerostris darwini]
MVASERTKPGSRNSCHLNFISGSSSLFRFEIGCQPARNEPVTSPTKRLPPLLSPPFSARIPDSIRMHKRTTGNDFPPPHDGSRFYKPLESSERGRKFGRMLFSPHFTAERAAEVKVQHFINPRIWALGLALFSGRNGVMPFY